MGLYSDNPCRYCEDRYSGCHAKCEEYKAWKQELNDKKTKAYEANKLERELDSIAINSRRRSIEKRRSK